LHPRPRPSRLRRALLFLVPLALVAAALGIWLTTRGDDDEVAARGTTAAAPTTEPAAPVTDTPATVDPERTGGEPVPTEPPTDVATDAPVTPDDGGDEVTPQLTYYGWNADIGGVEAGGIVQGVVESVGTCTLTLTQDSTEVDVSAEAVDNVTSMSCPAMTVPRNRLEPGTWQATLSYESGTSRGVSDAVEVEVP
jgi:hypothetical protein